MDNFPIIIKSQKEGGRTIGKILKDNNIPIDYSKLPNKYKIGDKLSYDNGVLKLNGRKLYTVNKNRVISNSKINITQLNISVGKSKIFYINKGDWASKVVGKQNSIKFKSVLGNFQEVYPGDKIKIDGNNISLIRGSKKIKNYNISGRSNIPLDKKKNNIENNNVFNERIKLLRKNIKIDYNNLKNSPSISHIKKSSEYKRIPSLLRGNGIFGEGGLSNNNKLPIPNEEGKLIAKGTFERNDGKLTLPENYKPYSFLTLRRKDGATIVGYYGENKELKYGTYTSLGKGTNSENKSRYGGKKGFNIKPMFKDNHNNSKYTNIDHVSSNEDKSFMMYSIGIKGGYRFHYYKTSGFDLSGGCNRLPIAYAKVFYEEVRKLEKKGIIPTYHTNQLY